MPKVSETDMMLLPQWAESIAYHALNGVRYDILTSNVVDLRSIKRLNTLAAKTMVLIGIGGSNFGSALIMHLKAREEKILSDLKNHAYLIEKYGESFEALSLAAQGLGVSINDMSKILERMKPRQEYKFEIPKISIETPNKKFYRQEKHWKKHYTKNKFF